MNVFLFWFLVHHENILNPVRFLAELGAAFPLRISVRVSNSFTHVPFDSCS